MRRRWVVASVSVFFLLIGYLPRANPAVAAPPKLALASKFTGLASPVFVTSARDGSNRLFIVEQAGLVKVAQPGSSTPTTFLDLRPSVSSGGERGLLGLAFHPSYETSRRFYVFYTRRSDVTSSSPSSKSPAPTRTSPIQQPNGCCSSSSTHSSATTTGG